jgi:streptogramin lyase
LWIAATGNHVVARLDLAASWVDIACGNGLAGFAGDGGPADEASFDRPSSVAFGPDGTMYVSDRMNSVVRAVSPDGIVSTAVGVPGEPGYDGDGGPATAARLGSEPWNKYVAANRVAVRGERLVIADTGNHVIREVDLATGIIDTLAGDGVAGWADGASARFSAPHDVAIGEDGVVWVADSGNACVRAIAPDGTVSTAAGVCGEPGSPADGLLRYPVGVAISGSTVWVVDQDSHQVLRFCPESA